MDFRWCKRLVEGAEFEAFGFANLDGSGSLRLRDFIVAPKSQQPDAGTALNTAAPLKMRPQAHLDSKEETRSAHEVTVEIVESTYGYRMVTV